MLCEGPDSLSSQPLRQLVRLQRVPLILALFLVNQPSLVDDVTLPMPDITRIVALPRSAYVASDNRLAQPTCLFVRISQLRVALTRICTRPRRSCEGRKRLVLATPDISGSGGKAREVDADRRGAQSTPKRSVAARSTHDASIAVSRAGCEPLPAYRAFGSTYNKGAELDPTYRLAHSEPVRARVGTKITWQAVMTGGAGRALSADGHQAGLLTWQRRHPNRVAPP